MTFTIPGDPIGKERPRVVKGHAYTPAKTKAYEDKVRWEIKKQHPGIKPFPKGAQLEMWIIAGFAIPKRVSKKIRADMLNGTIRPTKAPDSDNIGKSIMDAAQGIVYENDSSIVALAVAKIYAETPSVIVHVREIEGANSPK